MKSTVWAIWSCDRTIIKAARNVLGTQRRPVSLEGGRIMEGFASHVFLLRDTQFQVIADPTGSQNMWVQ